MLSTPQAAVVAFATTHPGTHVLVHGPAGTGKSRVLLRLLHDLPDALCLAPTGMAVNAIPDPRVYTIDRYLHKPPSSPRPPTNVLLDEISMLDANRLCRLDQRLQRLHGSAAPFGGCRLVLFGDMYQLESIAFPFFTADIWQHIETHLPLRVFQLNVLHRLDTTDLEAQDEFRHFLTTLRYNTLPSDVRARGLLDYYFAHKCPPPPDTLVLCAKRERAAALNSTRVAALAGHPYTFWCPVRRVALVLKLGMRVMVEQNVYDPATGHLVACNGQLGTLTALAPLAGSPAPRPAARIVLTPKHPWRATLTTPAGDTVAVPSGPAGIDAHPACCALPLTPAYAITMHKIQGQTLDCAVIDGTDLFGGIAQLYTAFSRLRTLHTVYTQHLDSHTALAACRPRAPVVQAFIEKHALH